MLANSHVVAYMPTVIPDSLLHVLHQQPDKGGSLISDSRISLAFLSPRGQAFSPLYCVPEFSFSHVPVSHILHTVSTKSRSSYASSSVPVSHSWQYIPKIWTACFEAMALVIACVTWLTWVLHTFGFMFYKPQNKSALHVLNFTGCFVPTFTALRLTVSLKLPMEMPLRNNWRTHYASTSLLLLQRQKVPLGPDKISRTFSPFLHFSLSCSDLKTNVDLIHPGQEHEVTSSAYLNITGQFTSRLH